MAERYHQPMPLAVRRLSAFAIDWCTFALWAAAVFAVVWWANDGELSPPAPSPWRNQAYGALFTTVPLLAWFALWERSASGATPGKRLLGIRVTTDPGRAMTLPRALLRSAVKLLPWELGHTAAHQLAAAGFAERTPPAWTLPLAIASQIAALAWLASLFVGPGRTPHDIASATHVTREKCAN